MLVTFFEGLASQPLLRAGLAAGVSLATVLLVIPRLAAAARRREFGDREDKTHSETLNALRKDSGKGRTPIVGGIGILSGVLVASLLLADWSVVSTWALCGVLFGLGAVGFLDDYSKTFGRQAKSSGLSARQKLVAQGMLGLGVGALLLTQASAAGLDDSLTTLNLPFVAWALPLGGLGFLALSAFLVTGTSNAVNLTDGLDGLAGGCALVAFSVYLAIAGSLSLHPPAFGLTPVPGASEVAVILASLVGALAGFLVYNRAPAQVFMGDTGSLALGGGLATAAILTKQELLLALVGGVFVAEALSVMAQVASFKLTGKRVLLCAPLHHHFEFKGWSEVKVVGRFHAVALALGLISLAGLHLTAG